MIEEIIWKYLARKSSVVNLTCGMFRNSEKYALKHNEEQFAVVVDHLQNWIDPIRALIARYPLEKWKFVGYTFGELFADLMITVSSITGGAYFNAVRTMRAILESMIHAAYVDLKFPLYPGLLQIAIDEKISEDKFDNYIKDKLRNELNFTEDDVLNLTGFKVRMIDELEYLTEDEKSNLHTLYSEISRLVHPTPLQLKKLTDDAFLGVTFFFDEKF